jgi:hypothetical protein
MTTEIEALIAQEINNPKISIPTHQLFGKQFGQPASNNNSNNK